MGDNSTTKSGGISFFSLLTILFITLKLTGHIAWSWWWVLAPMWLPPAILIAFVLMVFIIAFVTEK